MNVTIRHAIQADLAAVQDMNHRLFLSDAAYAPELDPKWPYKKEGVRYFEDKIAQKHGICFVAVAGDKPVGYLAGGVRGPASAWTVRRTEIENMFVEQAHRGNGIGSALIGAFFEWSRQQGAKRVIVGAFADNTRAIRFYQSNTFTPHEIVQEAIL